MSPNPALKKRKRFRHTDATVSWKCTENDCRTQWERCWYQNRRECCGSGAQPESPSSAARVGGLCLPQLFHGERKPCTEGNDTMSSFFLNRVYSIQSLTLFNMDEGVCHYRVQESSFFLQFAGGSCYIEATSSTELIHPGGLYRNSK